VTESSDQDYEQWAADRPLGSQSTTTQQLYENRLLTVQDYISQFRKASINSILPESAKSLTVEDALAIGKIDDINIRKLLTDNRDKFSKR
jgi:hypothetical protein